MINLSIYEIISFDLFDTLFLRKIRKPTDIFEIVEYISKTNEFAKKRILAEKNVRKKSQFEEVTLDEIYDNLDFSNKDELKEFELEIEEEFIYVNPKIKAILNKAKEKKKKIILVSDMYLPQYFIENILKKYNIHYDKLYLSSTIKKTKASGNLFEYILDDLKISSTNLFHIGDSYYSDIKMAKKFDIHTYFYENHLEYCKRNNLIEKESEELALKIVDGLIVNKISLSNIEKDFWYLMGYKVAGILYFGFVLWLYEQVKKFNINKLVFLSRDGFILKSVFNKFLKKKNDKKIKTFYVFSSRNGYLSTDKKIIKKYFEKFIDNKKVFMVDIGWKGTIQNILNKVLDAEIYGFYLGVVDDLKIKNSFGYLFTNSNPREKFNIIQTGFEVVELLFTAPHKTLTKLIEKNNIIIPIFREDSTGLSKQDVFNLQKGIKDFFNDFYPLYEKYNLDTNKNAISKLKKLLEKPNVLEATKIGNILHSQDINGYLPLPIAKPKYSKNFYEKNPDVFQKDINESFWKVGFLKRLDKKNKLLSFEEMEKEIVNKLKNIDSIIIFGTAKAGEKTYEFLKYYKLEGKLKFFIDDFKSGKFLGKKIVTTKEFMNIQINESIIIYGKHQKISPLLEKDKNIKQIRIYSVI